MTSSADYLALGIKDGYLNYQYNLGSGEVIVVYNVTKLDDGKWHTVRALRYNIFKTMHDCKSNINLIIFIIYVKFYRVEQEGSLIVDNGVVVTSSSPGPLNQLNINNGLYLGNLFSFAVDICA